MTAGCGAAQSAGAPLDPEAQRIESLMEQALAEEGAEKHDEALRTLETTLPLAEKRYGRGDLFIVINRYAALVLSNSGRPAREIEYLQRALDAAEKKEPRDDKIYAEIINSIAHAYVADGRLDEARATTERAVASFEARSKSSAHLADALNGRALVRDQQGDLEGAAADLERAFAMKKATGADVSEMVTALHNLGGIRAALGDFAAAEKMFVEARQLAETALRTKPSTSNRAAIAIVLSAYGAMLVELGRDDEAEAKYLEAVLRLREIGREGDVNLAIALANLGQLHTTRHKLDDARKELAGARAILEKRYGARNPSMVTLENAEALLAVEAGDLDTAVKQMEGTLASKRAMLGPAHPDVAIALHNLASIQRERGDLDGALANETAAIAIWEKALGASHRNIAVASHELFRIHLARGEIEAARDALARGIEVRNGFVAAALLAGSEYDKRRFLSLIVAETQAAVSMHLNLLPRDRKAARLALSTILFRKARAIDAAADVQSRVRARAGGGDDARWSELAQVNRSLAALGLRDMGGTSAPQQIEKLVRRKRELEAMLSIAAADKGDLIQPVAIEDVQAALPDGAALVEVVRYQPLPDPPKAGAEWQPARYAAYVLQKSGDPAAVDLGSAAELERATLDLIAHAKKPTGLPDGPLRALYTRLIAPVEAAAPEAKTWLVATDGALSLVPWGALTGPDGAPALARLGISYVTSGRDLLRFGRDTAAHGRSLLLGDPDYGSGKGPFFQAKRLPGTRAEVEQIASLVPGSRVLLGRDATESALKECTRPAILHLATHGVFIGDPAPPEKPVPRKGLLSDDTAPLRADDAQPRSFVVLAGANGAGEGGEDGTLTAVEAANLDLEGTQLVVLSACESAVGEVLPGDGVLGLRRAFFLAGAETQLATLWEIEDEATQAAMQGYYRRVLAGEGRAEALRHTQEEMRKTPRFAHPSHWAGFVVVGNPGPLSELHAVTSPAGRLPPSERGCACRAAGAGETGAPAGALAAAIGLLAAARRRRDSAPRRGGIRA